MVILALQDRTLQSQLHLTYITFSPQVSDGLQMSSESHFLFLSSLVLQVARVEKIRCFKAYNL